MNIGVVSDEKQDGLDAPVVEEVNETHRQNADDRLTIVARGGSDPGGFVPEVRRAVAAVDPKVALYDIRTMNPSTTRHVDGQTKAERSSAGPEAASRGTRSRRAIVR